MAHSQYVLANHTILPLIYRVLQPKSTAVTYLMKEPQTKSLLMFGSSPAHLPHFFKQCQNNLQDLQRQTQSQLKYIFFNWHQNSQRIQALQKRKTEIITPQIQGDLKPIVLGDLSICFIDASGYKKPFSLIAVTHLTENSTKFPVLFPNKLLKPCSIDFANKAVKPTDYLSSLEKVKFFPNQTYIFPSQTVEEQDLMFAKALHENSFIDQKIALYEKNKKFGDALIPTTLLEQKLMNPFFMCQKFKELLGTSDKVKSFDLLRKMRSQFKI